MVIRSITARVNTKTVELMNEMDMNASAALNAIINKYKEDIDHSITDYSRAIELEQNHTDAWFYRGISSYFKGELDHAISDFNRVVELKPSDADVWYVRCITHRDSNEMERAIADLDKFRAIETDSHPARVNLTAYQNDLMVSSILGRDLISEFAIRDYNIEMLKPAFLQYEHDKLIFRMENLIQTVLRLGMYVLIAGFLIYILKT